MSVCSLVALLMEMEAETAAWGSTALTVYLEKLGKPRWASVSWTVTLGEEDTTCRRVFGEDGFSRE